MGSEGTRWVARVEDVVRLEDQDGSLICVLQGKTAAALLALSKAGPKGLSRDRIGTALWPNVNLDACRVSLRQTLTRLRRSLGASAIISDRSSCRLRDGLTVEIVHTNPQRGFELRGKYMGPSPLSGFIHFSEWLSDNDPVKLFEALRVNLEFALLIPPKPLLRLLDRAQPRLNKGDPNLKWCCFWRGAANMQQGVRHATPYLREAASRAVEAGDQLLTREASYSLALCEILSGEAKRGLDLSDRAIFTMSNHNLPQSGRFADLRSSALLHLGFKDDALKILERSADGGSGSAVETAKNGALLGLYMATSGDLRGASRVNEEPYRLSRDLGTKAVEAICCLTEGYVEAIDQPERATERLKDLIEECKAFRYSHITLYGHETLAVALQNCKRPEEARASLRKAVDLRKDLGFRYTRWDRMRLKSLSASF